MHPTCTEDVNCSSGSTVCSGPEGSFHEENHADTCIIFDIVSEYDQEIPQSQTADYPVAPRGRAAQPSRGTRKSN